MYSFMETINHRSLGRSHGTSTTVFQGACLLHQRCVRVRRFRRLHRRDVRASGRLDTEIEKSQKETSQQIKNHIRKTYALSLFRAKVPDTGKFCVVLEYLVISLNP